MKKAKREIYVPWQHKFIAGLFFQLGVYSDRDAALYLQRESSYPKDGLAEAIFRSFAKGTGKFPKAWAELLLDKCTEAFIERWQNDIFNSALNSKSLNISKSSHIIESKLENKQSSTVSDIKPLAKALKPIEIQHNVLGDVAQRKTPLPKKETAVESQFDKNSIDQEEIAETKPLPEIIVKILTISLSESLEVDGRLNPRKLVRALNRRSSSYNIKRKEREIYFLGKRVAHKFIIPLDIKLAAQ